MSACSASSGLIADSTLATISVAGMLVGVTAKFNPFCSKDTSASQYFPGAQEKNLKVAKIS